MWSQWYGVGFYEVDVVFVDGVVIGDQLCFGLVQFMVCFDYGCVDIVIGQVFIYKVLFVWVYYDEVWFVVVDQMWKGDGVVVIGYF